MIAAALFLPIEVYVSYKDKKADITFSYGKIKFKLPSSTKREKKNKTKKPKNKKSKKNKDAFGKFLVFFAALQAFYDTSSAIRKCIKIKKLKADVSYDSGDAAFTGMTIGFAYAEIYKLIGFLSVIFTVVPPEITLTPIFNDEYFFEAEAESIIKTKAAHIIFTGTKFYLSYKKALKERID